MQNGELKNKFLFSLDVVSLYPSVHTDAAIDTEKNNIHLYPFSVADIILLLLFILKCQRKELTLISEELFLDS